MSLPFFCYGGIDLDETEIVPSHKHPLIKHKPGHHTNWRCDRITGAAVCKSEINSYNSNGVQGWRCNQCDFDLCIACMQVSKFIERMTQRED